MHEAQDEDRLKQIRKNAKVVVAMGSCAAIGGINCIRNYKDLEEVRKTVYGDQAKLFDTYAARPIDAIVKVDAYVHGCPINRDGVSPGCEVAAAWQET